MAIVLRERLEMILDGETLGNLCGRVRNAPPDFEHAVALDADRANFK
jgi:hypothetical protein